MLACVSARCVRAFFFTNLDVVECGVLRVRRCCFYHMFCDCHCGHGFGPLFTMVVLIFRVCRLRVWYSCSCGVQVLVDVVMLLSAASSVRVCVCLFMVVFRLM